MRGFYYLNLFNSVLSIITIRTAINLSSVCFQFHLIQLCLSSEYLIPKASFKRSIIQKYNISLQSIKRVDAHLVDRKTLGVANSFV